MPIFDGTYYIDECEAEAPKGTIVFAHGFLWSGEMFRAQIDALKQHYRCIAVDFRGQGQSSVTNSGYDMDSLADDIVGLVRHLEITNFHYVGLSMGGFVGLRVALRTSEQLQSLVLLSTSADKEPPIRWLKVMTLRWALRFLGIRVVANFAKLVLYGRQFLMDRTQVERRRQLDAHLISNDPTGIARAGAGVIYRQSMTEKIGLINVPTLVATGSSDLAIPAKYGRRIAGRIPGAEFRLVPEAGHAPSVEKPAVVAEMLKTFYDRLSAR